MKDRLINIAINGYPRSGKDTFVDLCKEVSKFRVVCKYSSVDQVKSAARLLGWDGIKDKDTRNFLSLLKDESDKVFDTSFRYMKDRIECHSSFIDKWNVQNQYFLFFHMREPENIERFCKEFDSTRTLFIRRDGLEEFDNHADRNVNNYNYEFVIDNNGSIDELRIKAEKFLDNFKIEDI